MSLLGLDINASRLRAVSGPLGDYPRTMAVDPPRSELPMVVSIQGRLPVVGSAGLQWCRRAPQLVWQDFLPQLGEKPPGRKWPSKLDAGKALGLAFQQAARACGEAESAVLAVPTYLSGRQIEQMSAIGGNAGLRVLGSVWAVLAAALTAHAEQAWFSNALVVDVDDHALTVARSGGDHGEARRLDSRVAAHLIRRVWQERLLNALADCCIIDSRWDPRSSPAAEQALFGQLDDVLEAAQLGRTTQMAVQTPQRYQKIVLQPHDPAAFCGNLCRQAVAEVVSAMAAPWLEGTHCTVLLTADAARLPGLAAELRAELKRMPLRQPTKLKPTLSSLEDFGSGLLDGEVGGAATIVVLPDSALARGAHSVAAYFQRGDLPPGHLQAAAPLPLPQPLEAGPARLHFQGKDYLLGNGIFVIGRHQGADLLFDGELWPGVSAPIAKSFSIIAPT